VGAVNFSCRYELFESKTFFSIDRQVLFVHCAAAVHAVRWRHHRRIGARSRLRRRILFSRIWFARHIARAYLNLRSGFLPRSARAASPMVGRSAGSPARRTIAPGLLLLKLSTQHGVHGRPCGFARPSPPQRSRIVRKCSTIFDRSGRPVSWSRT
jgi:hypothetical protein